MSKVYVLMSTYNGERYLTEQIDSILSQKNVEVELYIRDDGSEDSTTKIIRKLTETDDRIHLFEEHNVGIKYSFLYLIQMVPSDADYYAFSDQDDYWMENKLYEAIRKIENSMMDKKPTLYYSHTSLVDETLSGLDLKNPYNKDNVYTFGQIMIKNCASGCTMVFDRELMRQLALQDIGRLLPTPLHDHWIYMVCRAIGGNIIFDNRSFILYRQHGKNEVGGKRPMWRKIITSPLFTGGNRRYLWAKQLHDQYGKSITSENTVLLNKIINYKNSFRDTIILALDKEIKPQEKIEKIAIALTVLRRGF